MKMGNEANANLWLNVLTDSAYARARAKSSTAQKVRVSNYKDFANLVSTTPKSFDPEHSNVAIHTDGTIAAVYFDFVFNVDGKANNRGSESWQLVKAADGWRIASIIYSFRAARGAIRLGIELTHVAFPGGHDSADSSEFALAVNYIDSASEGRQEHGDHKAAMRRPAKSVPEAFKW